jgi:hypothetical protein
MHRKFKAGTSSTTIRDGPASSWQYKIVRLLPAEGSDLLYRIKSPGETFALGHAGSDQEHAAVVPRSQERSRDRVAI